MIQRRRGIVPKTAFSWGDDEFNGAGRLAAFMPVNPFYTFTTALYAGNYFFSGMGLESWVRNPFVFKYNPRAIEIEQVRYINVSGIVTYDIHRMPTMSVDDSGNLYMAAEELQIPANGGHASPIHLYKTTIPGDIGSLKDIKTLTNRWAYPHVYATGSTVYIFARGTNSNTFIRGQYWMHKSTDGGVNFASPVKIYDSGDEQKVAYFQRIHDYSAGNLYLVLNERDNDNFNYKYVAVIKSTDGGVTWTNMSGSFSKVVGVAGAITRTEMRTNCMVYENTPGDNNKGVSYEGGCVKSNGELRIVLSPQTKTGNSVPTTGVEEIVLDELRFYVYSGGSWTYKNITIPSNMTFYWAADKPTRYINTADGTDYVVVINVSTRDVTLQSSTDNFNTQSSQTLLSGTGHSYRMGDMAYNATTIEEQCLVIADPIGDPLLWQNESTTNYTNIKLHKL